MSGAGCHTGPILVLLLLCCEISANHFGGLHFFTTGVSDGCRLENKTKICNKVWFRLREYSFGGNFFLFFWKDFMQKKISQHKGVQHNFPQQSQYAKQHI